MANISIKLLGVDKVVAALKDYFPGRLRVIMVNAIRANAEDTVAIAKSLAPVKTGALKASIKASVNASALRATVSAGNAEVNYALYQEYGTGAAAINPDNLRTVRSLINTGARLSKRAGGVTPKLYLNTAIEITKPRLVTILEHEVNKIIRSSGLH